MNRPDEPPEAAPEPPNLPEFTRFLHGDFSGVDWRIFWTALPVVVFLVLNTFWPEDLWRTQVAIVGSFLVFGLRVRHEPGQRGDPRARGARLRSSWQARPRGRPRRINSAKAFAAQNIFTDFIMAAISLGSVLAGKPLVGAVARQGVPALRTLMDPKHRVFVYLTLTFMAINIFTGIFRIFLLGEFNATEYVLISRATGLPFSVGFLVACYFSIKRSAGVGVRLPSI